MTPQQGLIEIAYIVLPLFLFQWLLPSRPDTGDR
jgi:hypothetical protein